MTDSDGELNKSVTDVLCPDCSEGKVIVHVDSNGMLVRETCTACKFSSDVLEAKTEADAAAKDN